MSSRRISDINETVGAYDGVHRRRHHRDMVRGFVDRRRHADLDRRCNCLRRGLAAMVEMVENTNHEPDHSGHEDRNDDS
jgi:hypothetical protein